MAVTDPPIDRFAQEYQGYHRITPKRAREQLILLHALDADVDGGILQAQASDIQAFAGALLAKGQHVNTIRKKLNMLRSFFSWAYAVQLIDADRYLQLKSVKDPRGASGRTVPKPYSRKELTRFWAEVDESLPLLPETGPGCKAIERWLTGIGPWGRVWRHAMRLQMEAMVRLALDLGLRRAEIYELSIHDLHYDNEYIVVTGKADPNTGEPKVREVPFTPEARRAIQEWVEFRALLRPSHTAAWLSLYGEAAVRPMRFDRFEGLLGVVGDGWTWHRFRHTCATEWLRAGMELETLMRMLGHSNISQTLAYAQIVKSDVARQMDKHGEVFAEAVTNRAA